ncbi:MAG: hypothetical protein ACYTKD_31990 [Planctomycetota bacterium]|jgi:hypothetical protein
MSGRVVVVFDRGGFHPLHWKPRLWRANEASAAWLDRQFLWMFSAGPLIVSRRRSPSRESAE